MDQSEDFEDEGNPGGDGPAPDARRHVLDPPPDLAGRRLDQWLAASLPELSRARLQALIAQGRVTRAGEAVKGGSQKIRLGQPYVVEVPQAIAAAPRPQDLPVPILFEDAHLAVVLKPAGMATHPGAGIADGTLVNALLFHLRDLSGVGGVARPGIVHRLDKDTSGVMVVAKSDAAHASLTRMFAAHALERMYLALTQGAPHPRTGEIETRLGRAPHDRLRMAVLTGESGRRALTRWWTIETYGQARGAAAGRGGAAQVECRLETGRTHQIRVHMAHLGAPLIGDPLYGARRPLRFEETGPRADAAQAMADGFGRQALHAALLAFRHPVTDAPMRFEVPPPADFIALRDALRAV